MKVDDEPKGRARGGKARAEKLTPEQRSEIAKKGAAARWGAGILKATHKGNFKEEFGIDVECYVLNDGAKTAVISQRGMAAAIGLSIRGDRLQRFCSQKSIAPYIGPELRFKLDNHIVFQLSSVAPKDTNAKQIQIHGYDVTILIDLCKAILVAESNSESISDVIAKQAHIILSASAKAGIQGLVYALAGYDRTREEVIAAYKMYVMEEAREYEREFSPELYEQWYRLYGLVKPERGRPWEFKYLTIDHIYRPLAKSNGKIFELAKSSKQTNGERSNKIHQFLSEIGVKALRTQVGKITGIATVSESKEEYEKYIAEKIYGQKSLF